MKILVNIVRGFLILFLFFLFAKYFFIYKDVIFSIGSKEELKGEITYGSKGYYIRVIEFPSEKNKILYTCPLSYKEHVRYVYYPFFSPDGSMIVFSQSEHLFDDKLYIMDADGTNMKLFLDLGEVGNISSSWSPDGKKIAFVIQGTDKQGLYIIKISDRSITRISEINPSLTQPAWSPDNKKIAFTSDRRERKDLGNGYYEERILGGTYIINIDTQEVEQYIDGASEPAWSPDGEMFAYGDKFGYHVVNLSVPHFNDEELLFIPHKKVPFGIAGAVPIRWSPDGKYFVFCKEVWPRVVGIYVVSIDNPKRQIRIATDHESIIGMSWGR